MASVFMPSFLIKAYAAVKDTYTANISVVNLPTKLKTVPTPESAKNC